MQNIDEILKEVGFRDWQVDEQAALAKLMYNFANKQPSRQVVCTTNRVRVTFIKILDTHLPEKEV